MDAQRAATIGIQARRMGEQERILHLLEAYAALLSVLVLHIRGPLVAGLVRRGLDHLQRCHPMLRAHIRFDGVGFRRGVPFVAIERKLVIDGTGPIPLTESVEDWHDVVRREHLTPLPRGRNPRARAVLVHAGGDGISRLVFTSDHAVGDAQAVGAGGRTLLEFLANPDAGVPASGGLPPALEDIYPVKSHSGTKRYQPAIRLPYPKDRSSPSETRTEVRYFSLSETGAIKTATQARRSTMHGTVAAALLKAIRERTGLDEMTVISTYEFRRMGKPPLPPDTYGCYIDALRTKHRIDGAFWPLAQDVAFKLIATIAKDQKVASMLKLPSLAIFLKEAEPTRKSAYRIDGLGLTTAGDLGFKRQYGPFVLEDVTLAASMQAVGPGIFASTMEREGTMSLTLAYSPRSVPTAEAAAIADRAASILRELPA